MKKILIITILMLLTLTASTATQPTIEEKFEKGEKTLQVIIEENVTQDTKRSFQSISTRDNTLKELNKTKTFNRGFVTNITESEFNKIKTNSKITIREPIQFQALLGDSAPAVNATKSWNLQLNSLNLTGTGQTICVLDTGTTSSHPDLQNEILTEKCFCDNSGACCPNGQVEDTDATDGKGHGTHVSGIITANGAIKGIAPDSKIVAVKMMDNNGDGNELDLISSMEWCIDNAATYNISIISASLGARCDLYPELCYDTRCGDISLSLRTQINRATQSNISVIFASGNDNNKTHVSWPSCLPNTTIVSATNNNNDAIASFSNINSLVKLVAPGTSINSTWNDGGYYLDQGTSMATPMVAGAIAIIRQYLQLTSQTKTPSEIEYAFYNNGNNITLSTINYSTINIFDTIISLDIDNPSVTLISPENNSISLNETQTFNINFSDIQLRNMTFFLWNTTSLVNQTNQTLTGQEAQVEINITNLPETTYYWAAQAYDQNNNSYTANNYTIVRNHIQTTISSPTNNTFTSENQTNFTCTSQTSYSAELENITLYVYNSTTLVYNTTTSISGTSNTTTFNYTLPSETSYVWNCLVYSNRSETKQSDNYTLTYDITNPNLTITESPTDQTIASVSKIFYFNTSDNNENTNCSLILNSLTQESKTITNYTITNNFTIVLTPNTYNWQVNCSDQASNSNLSTLTSFTITLPTVSDSGGGSGGGGGGASEPVKGTLNNPVAAEEIEQGYTHSFREKTIVHFTNSHKENHSITLEEIIDNKVNLTIQSEPINLILEENSQTKLNLSTPEFLDTLIEVGKISKIDAQITITKIKEKNPNFIPKEFIALEKNNSTTDDIDKSKSFFQQNKSFIREYPIISIIFSVVITLIILILIIIFSIKHFHTQHKANHRQKHINTVLSKNNKQETKKKTLQRN
jgi:subtilisin family serine protease